MSSWKCLHIFTPTDVDFFCSKCVKFVIFSILEDYTWIDVDALRKLVSFLFLFIIYFIIYKFYSNLI